MTNFIDQIAQGVPFDANKVIGYSDEELKQIERLYDIAITGQLRQFLLDMGRSDGGLIGDDPIFLYRNEMSVRRHVMMQLRLEFDFNEYRIETGIELLKRRPFLFSVESETQYFFVVTKSDNPDRVYHYNENDETVKDTELNFIDHMKQTVMTWGGKSKVVTRGELLIV